MSWTHHKSSAIKGTDKIIIKTQGVAIRDQLLSKNSAWSPLEIETRGRTKTMEIIRLRRAKSVNFTCLTITYPNRKVTRQHFLRI